MTTTIEPVKLEDVSSVYSGINGRCCCGCSGKHTYASAHREWASKHRGYAVTDEDINDRTVKMLVNKINKNLDKVEYDERPELVSVVLGNRLYVAYLKH